MVSVAPLVDAYPSVVVGAVCSAFSKLIFFPFSSFFWSWRSRSCGFLRLFCDLVVRLGGDRYLGQFLIGVLCRYLKIRE